MTNVRRRLVYYISGYDPRGPDPYRALYHDEAARQDALTGTSRTVGPITRVDRWESRWTLADTRGTTGEVRFLRYDDLVRRNWPRTPSALWRAAMATTWDLLRWGLYRHIRSQSRTTWFTGTFPIVMLGALLVPPPLLAAAAGWATHGNPLAIAGGALLGLPASWALWHWIVRIRADWLARIFYFLRQCGRGRVPELEARWALFGERIAEGMADPEVEEVLVVGHSVGAAMAIAALSRAMRRQPAPRPAVGLLTLGQTISLIGMLPNGQPFRDDLAAVAGNPLLPWLDVSSPVDGACVALRDPVAGCGLASTGSPKLLNARFHRQFAPERYRTVRRDRFRIHFQYLMAAETTGGFDYFEATTGPQPFRDLVQTAG